MDRQLASLGKTLIAKVTLVFLFACMRGNMLCQRGRSGQLAATDLTGVLLVLFALHTDIDRCRNLVRIRNEQLALRIEVHVVMAPHFVLVNETLLAQLTDVRAFTGMQPRVNRQRALLGERLAADVAHERDGRLAVVLHVALQVFQMLEDPVAHRAGHYPGQSVPKLVLHDFLRIAEREITVATLGFRYFRFVVGPDVVQGQLEGWEIVGAKPTEARSIGFRFGTSLLVLFELFRFSEGCRATFAYVWLSGKVLRTCSMIQEVSYCAERLPASLAIVSGILVVIAALVKC